MRKVLQNNEKIENRLHINNTRDIRSRKWDSTLTPASFLSSSLTIRSKTYLCIVLMYK